jgi:hypothetical protein
LGIYDVDNLLENTSIKQLSGWYFYYQLEPWGYEIDNIRHNLKQQKQQSKQNPQESLNIAKNLCALFGGKDG